MIPKEHLEQIKKNMAALDECREKIIKTSRDILRLSKLSIYQVHRNENEKAAQTLHQAEKKIEEIMNLIKENPEVDDASFNNSLEEYVEAKTFLNFSEDKRLPSHKELQVGEEVYLLGLCDLTGELVRYAINNSIVGKYQEVSRSKDLVESLYSMMLEFNFRNSNLRRKFDSIKYNLQKIVDLLLELKLKDKIN